MALGPGLPQWVDPGDFGGISNSERAYRLNCGFLSSKEEIRTSTSIWARLLGPV